MVSLILSIQVILLKIWRLRCYYRYIWLHLCSRSMLQWLRLLEVIPVLWMGVTHCILDPGHE